MRKLRLAILRNEVADDHILWQKACEEMSQLIDWEVIDITKYNWLEQVTGGSFDGLLAIPGAYTSPFRELYNERLTILNSVNKIPVFPSLEEILIFENKKYFAYWLAAKKIPHPKTWVFYYENEALDFLSFATLPIVAKTNIGAGGSGVIFLNTESELKNYVHDVFSGKGITHRSGPKWSKKGFANRVLKKLMHPEQLKTKLSTYKLLKSERQTDFVIFQEFIPHTFEWRCVRIGDSFFAHKKLVKHGKASGSLLKGYETPPESLLNFLKDITDSNHFTSQAIDIFVTEDGTRLVNEMQCIFGQSDPYQMLINGVPGRYIYKDDKWVFEAGDFTKHECFLLRLETFINILNKQLNL